MASTEAESVIKDGGSHLHLHEKLPSEPLEADRGTVGKRAL